MADVKFTEFTAIGTGFVPTDILVGVDISANDNIKLTLNNLFAYPFSRNVTDGAERSTTIGSAPTVSGAGEAARYFDGTRYLVSYNGGAFKSMIEGTPGATGRVPYFDSAGSLTSSANLSFVSDVLTVGAGSTQGAVKLNGINGNAINLSVQNPAANRTFYLPDVVVPTAGQGLYAETVGVTTVLGWQTFISGMIAANQVAVGSGTNAVSGSASLAFSSGTLTASGAVNSAIGGSFSNSNTGTASQCVVDVNETTVCRLGVTSQGFTTSGLNIANQGMVKLFTGGVELLFEIVDAATRFRWGINGSELMRLNSTGLGLNVTSPSTKLDVDSGAGNTSGVRMRQLTSASPAGSSTAYIAVDASGNIVRAQDPTGSIGGSIAANQVAFGSGTNTLAGNSALTWDNTNQALQVINDSVGIAQEDGFILANTTAATVSNQEYSPLWRMHGQGWKSVATAESRPVDVAMQLQTVAGGSNPAGNLVWMFRVNNGAWTTRLTLRGSDGALVAQSSVISQTAVTAEGGLLQAGVAASQTGRLTLYHSGGSTTTSWEPANAASSLNYIWPATDPTAGQSLTASAPSSGNVSLAWTTITGTISGLTSGKGVYGNSATTIASISGMDSDGANVTFGSGALRATLPRITTGLNDVNGNELLLFTATASAVNELTYANAATGNSPTITCSGNDSNVSLNIVPKGTGSVGIATASPEAKLEVTPDTGDRADKGIRVNRIGTGSGAGASWGVGIRNSVNNDAIMMGFSSSAYTTGGALGWVGNSEAFIYYPQMLKIGTGIGSVPVISFSSVGNVGIGTAIFSASAQKVLSVANGAAPNSAPVDVITIWSADFNSTAGDARLHLLTESGIAQVLGNNAIGAASASGTDQAGTSYTVFGGQSTGTGLGGSILFQVANKAGTGSGVNALGTVLTLAPPNSGTTAVVNGLTITGAIASGPPSISATGSDSNINLTLTPKGTGRTIGTGVIDATTGFRVNNAATSGQYLRGNGTNFISAALAYADFPTITGGTLLGNNNASAAVPGEISMGLGLELIGGGLRTTNRLLNKASGTSRTSTTTPTADPDLSANVDAGATYFIDTVLFVSNAGATAGFKVGFNGTATTTGFNVSVLAVNPTDGLVLSAANLTALNSFAGMAMGTAVTMVQLRGTITVNAAGSLAVYWSQNTSNANATVVQAGSNLFLNRATLVS